MSPNLLGVFGALAKNGAEVPTVRAGRIAGLFQEGYLHWLDGVAASVESGTRFVSGLPGVTSSADLTALNCEWMNRTQALAVEQWETFVELSSQLSVELGLPRPPVSTMLPFAMTPPLDAVFTAGETPSMAVPAAVPIPVPPSEEPLVAPLTAKTLPEEGNASPEHAPAEPAAPISAEPTSVEPASVKAISVEPVPAPDAALPPGQALEAAVKAPAPKLASTLKSGASKAAPRTAEPRRKPSPPKGPTPVQ